MLPSRATDEFAILVIVGERSFPMMRCGNEVEGSVRFTALFFSANVAAGYTELRLERIGACVETAERREGRNLLAFSM